MPPASITKVMTLLLGFEAISKGDAKWDDLLNYFFFPAEDGIRDLYVTGVQTCALPISAPPYMQISAGVRRNSICGPGCAEIVTVDAGDIRHTPAAEAVCSWSPGSGLRPLSGRVPTVFSVGTGGSNCVLISEGYRRGFLAK